jgi:drug/metabolite transporter (DMT)-like permease
LSVTEILELLLAAALIVGGAVLYRRRGRMDGSRGSQSAVILIFIGLILAIHGLGLMEYRPSQSEIDAQAIARQRP